jgi:hypothetical protein
MVTVAVLILAVMDYVVMQDSYVLITAVVYAKIMYAIIYAVLITRYAHPKMLVAAPMKAALAFAALRERYAKIIVVPSLLIFVSKNYTQKTYYVKIYYIYKAW